MFFCGFILGSTVVLGLVGYLAWRFVMETPSRF